MSELKYLLPIMILLSVTASAEPNPSAVYCIDMGYNYVIVHTLEGDMGVCQFPDGSYAGAWDFLLGNERADMSYCETNGYEWKISNSSGICPSLAESCVVCVTPSEIEMEASIMAAQDPKDSFVDGIESGDWKPASDEETPGLVLEDVGESSLFLIVLLLALVVVSVVIFRMRRK